MTQNRPVDATIMAIVDEIAVDGETPLREGLAVATTASTRGRSKRSSRACSSGSADAPTAAPKHADARRTPSRRSKANIPRGTNGVYADADQAAKAARKAFEQNERTPVAARAIKMVEAMRRRCSPNNDALSRYAVEETGLGRYEDKLAKNKLVAEKTPGCEILRPIAYTGDDGLMLTERAPYGVMLAITPTTNPTETILCNAIGMVAAGNAVVFNVHPSAAQVCNWCVHLLNEAIQAVGGPRDVIVSIEKPTVESAQTLMKHPLVRHRRRHRRPGRRQAGDELGQEGDQRRARAIRRPSSTRPRTSARPPTRSCAARRSTTTSSASPRRKSSRSIGSRTT